MFTLLSWRLKLFGSRNYRQPGEIRRLMNSNDGNHFDFGVAAYRQGDLKAAKTWFEKAAELGDTVAMFNLGVIARDEKNLNKAKTWFEKAAELGDGLAMVNLGAIADDEGNSDLAENWFQRSIEVGAVVPLLDVLIRRLNIGRISTLSSQLGLTPQNKMAIGLVILLDLYWTQEDGCEMSELELTLLDGTKINAGVHELVDDNQAFFSWVGGFSGNVDLLESARHALLDILKGKDKLSKSIISAFQFVNYIGGAEIVEDMNFLAEHQLESLWGQFNVHQEYDVMTKIAPLKHLDLHDYPEKINDYPENVIKEYNWQMKLIQDAFTLADRSEDFDDWAEGDSFESLLADLGLSHDDLINLIFRKDAKKPMYLGGASFAVWSGLSTKEKCAKCREDKVNCSASECSRRVFSFYTGIDTTADIWSDPSNQVKIINCGNGAPAYDPDLGECMFSTPMNGALTPFVLGYAYSPIFLEPNIRASVLDWKNLSLKDLFTIGGKVELPDYFKSLETNQENKYLVVAWIDCHLGSGNMQQFADAMKSLQIYLKTPLKLESAENRTSLGETLVVTLFSGYWEKGFRNWVQALHEEQLLSFHEGWECS